MVVWVTRSGWLSGQHGLGGCLGNAVWVMADVGKGGEAVLKVLPNVRRRCQPDSPVHSGQTHSNWKALRPLNLQCFMGGHMKLGK